MPISEKFVDKSITELHVLAQLEKDVISSLFDVSKCCA